MAEEPWNKHQAVTSYAYADMTYAGFSMALSIHAFVSCLPYSRDDAQLMHDGMVIVFMALVIVHFFQLFEAVMLLSASEIDDPRAAIKLASSWANWSIFFMFLLIGKLAAVAFALQVNIWYMIYILFILSELFIRPLWRRRVVEFVNNLKETYPAAVNYIP